MDKNTIIGFLLIAAVMILFMITQRPDAEQIAQRERMQDSIQQLETERAKLKTEDVANSESKQSEVDSSDALASFFGEEESFVVQDTTVVEINEETKNDSEAELTSPSFKGPTSQPEEFVTIENDDVRLTVSSKGGWMHSAELMDFKRYDKDTLFLFKGDRKSVV